MAKVKTNESELNVLAAFRREFPSRTSRLPCKDAELVQLVESDGVVQLMKAPCADAIIGSPRTSRGDRGVNTHIWVIDSVGVPYILDQPVDKLGGKLPKHTNLAAEAHVGGELWFGDSDKITISGGSGRFPARSPEELEAAVRVFEAFEYSTRSLGWDSETGAPQRVLMPIN